MCYFKISEFYKFSVCIYTIKVLKYFAVLENKLFLKKKNYQDNSQAIDEQNLILKSL